MKKLSPELLSETFATIEGRYGGRVFVILGNARSLRTLVGVLEAHGVKTDSTSLWGALLVVNDNMVGGILHLCVHCNGPRPSIEDLHTAAPLLKPDEAPDSDMKRWSVELDLR